VIRPAFLALCLCAATGLSAETFNFSSDRVESVMAQGKERTVLSGRVRITSGTLSISADRVELVGKDSDLLLCTGSVVADDSDRAIHLETPSLRYERKRKFSHMEGASVLVDQKNKVVLKAQWIENSGETDITVAQVNVRILKDKLACRSEYAVYRRADKILELSGAPSVRKDGDDYRASRIVVNTDSEEIKLEGDVSGSIQSSDDKQGAAAPDSTGGTQ
jgi:lipopolysaccharide export system protein LptA